MQIKNQKDFWAGLLFIMFGAFFVGIGFDYGFGTAAAMGSGFFPLSVGTIVLLLGVGLAAKALVIGTPAGTIEGLRLIKLVWIIGPVVVFALMLTTAGLLLSLALLVILSSFATAENKFKGILINAAALTTLSWLIFAWALEMPLPLWPAGLSG